MATSAQCNIHIDTDHIRTTCKTRGLTSRNTQQLHRDERFSLHEVTFRSSSGGISLYDKAAAGGRPT